MKKINHLMFFIWTVEQSIGSSFSCTAEQTADTHYSICNVNFRIVFFNLDFVVEIRLPGAINWLTHKQLCARPFIP